MVSHRKLLEEAEILRNQKGNLTGALEKVEEVLHENVNSIPAFILKSILLRDNGDIVAARTVLQAAQDILTDNNIEYRSDIQRLLGFLDLLQGDTESALIKANKSLELATEIKSDKLTANAQALLGNIYDVKKDYKSARENYENALLSAQTAHYIEREVTVKINLASLEASTGDWKKSLELLNEIIEKSQNKWTKANFNALFEKLKIVRKQKLVDNDFIKVVHEAYKNAGSMGWADEEGNLAYQLALIYDDINQPEEAINLFRQARAIFNEAHITHKVSLVTQEMTARGYKDEN